MKTTSQYTQPCRRCLLRDLSPEDYQKYICRALTVMPRSVRAEEGTYEERLSICMQCDHLSNGTCMGCGCLVEIRAAQKKMKCPFGKWM